MSNENPDRLKRLETFLYIILVMIILIAVGMFLIIQQISNAVKEIKKFCWGEKVADEILPDGEQPYINIIH